MAKRYRNPHRTEKPLRKTLTTCPLNRPKTRVGLADLYLENTMAGPGDLTPPELGCDVMCDIRRASRPFLDLLKRAAPGKGARNENKRYPIVALRFFGLTGGGGG